MYSFDSRVRYSECDENGVLALVPMMNYLQDCSTFQCEEVGRGLKQLRDDHLGWFVTSWLIQIDSLPKFCDTITTSTWCYAMKRLQAERCFEIRGADGATHVRADSQWYMYDFSQERVISIPQSESVFLQGDERPADLPQISRHLKPQGEGTPTSPIVITEQHLDTNRHVNNAEYVRFALLAAGELGQAIDLARLEVQYRTMALLGDTLSPVVYGGGNDITVSINGEDGQARAIVRMEGRA
ncbi:acyl-[acyl-carrier-protein] thioesterase [Tractidigestivibacter montrealensis]|uniref:Thioesterase n=1 Tax=Tractidigestivibacter montrealensis TaxID=2972466 RepID=A0ABT1Z9H1_9ACTN|nr:acyl-ACP thioesterase domain-containing protein [Tractidigestivibacter montrealensis]MCR9036828.1 thioesterase [Tractidigestivibacter montrealensis]